MISKSNQSKSEIAEIHPDNRYQTPVSLAVAAMTELKEVLPPSPDILIDIGCGDLPIWGMAARVAGFLQPMAGVDIRPVSPTGHYYDLGVYSQTSFKDLRLDCKAPLILGNPPFSEVRNIVMYYHETYQYGFMYLLLKMEFLSPKKSGYAKRDDIWQVMKPTHIFPIGKRPGWWYYTPEMDFSRKTNSTDYAMYAWNLSKVVDYSYVRPMDWEIDEALEWKIRRMVEWEHTHF